MTGSDRPGFSGAVPVDSISDRGSATENASGLILRLRDSNRALEDLLRALERDESTCRSPHFEPDAYPFV
ncbi:hypothetical protein [Aureimonas altamirensis]|uniref:hypothetical protein n=1 Tax=Aureimonas altamirensis TaxID=370622 RepID=UPI000A4DC2EA|nr:hypothetical protein [Aureimonas altamirensis]